MRAHRGAIDRRVGRDDAVRARGLCRLSHLHQAPVGLVRRELHQHRDPAGQRVTRFDHFGDERSQLRLERAEPRRIRAGDIDRGERGMRRQDAERRDVILGCTLVRSVLVAADVDADGPWKRRQPPELLRHRRRAGVVEAHPVDDRALIDEPEQAGPFVSRLGPGGNRSDLHPAEPQAEPARSKDLALVHTGRQTERGRKIDPPQRLAEQRIRAGDCGRGRADAQQDARQAVRRFRLEHEQQRAHEEVHGRRSL